MFVTVVVYYYYYFYLRLTPMKYFVVDKDSM